MRSDSRPGSVFVAKRLFLAAAAATCAAGSSRLLAGQGPPDRPYVFLNAAGDFENTYGPPSLNNNGVAAFLSGTHPLDSSINIVGPDGVVHTVLHASGPYDGFDDPDVNDNNQVATIAQPDLFDDHIVRAVVGGPVATIAEVDLDTLNPGKFQYFDGTPSINNAGSVAFMGSRNDGLDGVFVGNGTAPAQPLASSANGFQSFGENVSYNNNGVAAFYAYGADDRAGIFTAGPNGIGTVALQGPGVSEFLSDPSINNHGSVAFVSYGQNLRLYKTGPGGALQLIASDDNEFDYFDIPLINDAGEVAFYGELDDGTAGLFDGPNSVADKIIMVGDPLFGSTVQWLSFQLPATRNGFNERAQVAFRYELVDGRQGIGVATPVPFGDASVDLVVNLADFNILAANFGQSGREWETGDFTGDGVVNLDDFNLLAANFGQSVGGPTVTPEDWARLAAAIPEPASLGLLLAAGAMCLRRRTR